MVCLAFFGRWGCFGSDRPFGVTRRPIYGPISPAWATAAALTGSSGPTGPTWVAPASTKDQPFAETFLPCALRRQLAHLRQSIETVFGRLLVGFGLEHERPHCLEGFLARMAARVGLHNFCIWLNRQLGRPDLAFADLVDCCAI